MNGEAFVQARLLMDKLRPVDHTMIEITTTDTFNLDRLNLCLRLVSNEVARWKSNTLNILNNLLKKARKEQIAMPHLDDYAKMLELVADDLSLGLKIDKGYCSPATSRNGSQASGHWLHFGRQSIRLKQLDKRDFAE